MKRARELMSIADWANAESELKLELKDSPKETTARGLLLYCIDRSDGLDKVDDLSMPQLDGLVRTMSAPDWQHAPSDYRHMGDKIVIEARKSLYDKGVDTADVKDLAAVVNAAARFGFANDDDDERKAADAGILAADGDLHALSFLVDRLKGEHPEDAVSILADVGSAAIPELAKRAADKNFLGRTAALGALSKIEGAEEAREFARPHPDYREPGASDTTVPGADQLGDSVISASADPDVTRVHGQYTLMGDGPADGVLLLQSWSTTAKRIVVALFAFRDGKMQRLHVVDAHGAAIDMGGASALFDLADEASGLQLKRIVQKPVTRQVESGEVKAPTAGMRVRLKGYEPNGTVVRPDQGGLWVVHVEQPIEGMSDLTVPASSMIGLEDKTTIESTVERLTLRLEGETLHVARVVAAGDCGVAAAQLVAVTVPEATDEQRNAARTAIVSSCRTDHWPDAFVACLGNMSEKSDFQGCLGKLPPADLAVVTKSFDELKKE